MNVLLNFSLNVPLLRSCMNLLLNIFLYVSQNCRVMYKPIDGNLLVFLVVFRSCLNLILNFLLLSSIVRSCMNLLVKLLNSILRCSQVMPEPILLNLFFEYFTVIRSCMNQLLNFSLKPPELSGHV